MASSKLTEAQPVELADELNRIADLESKLSNLFMKGAFDEDVCNALPSAIDKHKEKYRKMKEKFTNG